MSYELPFILWDNVMESGTITVDSEEVGFPKENMLDWLDWTYYKSTGPTSNQRIYIDKTSAGIEVDTLAVLGHNWGSGGSSIGTVVYVHQDDNPGFSSATLIGTVTLFDDEPFYLDLTPGTERYVRIWIINLESAIYSAVVFVGKKMEMPVGPEFSFDPDMQNIKSEKFVSYSGRMVSSAFKYSERKMTVPFRRLSQTFIDSDLLPFLEDHYGRMKPFFFVPDPGNVFGDDKIYYLTAPDDPTINLPVYEDDIGFRNWTMEAQGVRQSTFR
jgi:hypothetical protein